MNAQIFLENIHRFDDNNIFNKTYNELSDYRKNKIDKLKPLNGKLLSLCAGNLLKDFLYEFDLFEKNAHYIENEYGKEHIIELEDIHFNISHSNEYALLAVSLNEIGCDIEKVKDIDVSIANKYFTKEENDFINNFVKENVEVKNAFSESFFRIWTLKESFIKCLGKGLSIDLTSFSIIIDDTNHIINVKQNITNNIYKFTEYNLIPNYKISICEDITKQEE